MSPIFHAACWAIVILCIALAGTAEIIPAATANMLVTTLPLVMVATFAGSRRRCARVG